MFYSYVWYLLLSWVAFDGVQEVLSIPSSKIVSNKSGMRVKFSDKDVAAENARVKRMGQKNACGVVWVVVRVTLEVWQPLMGRPWEVT